MPFYEAFHPAKGTRVSVLSRRATLSFLYGVCIMRPPLLIIRLETVGTVL